MCSSDLGGPGNDPLTGAAGNDVYQFDLDDNLGADTLNEAGGGLDTVDFSPTTGVGVTVDLSLATVQTVATGRLTLVLGSATTFENIIGGANNDSLTGNTLANLITGGAGDDTLAGGTGNDSYLFDADTNLGTDTLTETATGGTDLIDFTEELKAAVDEVYLATPAVDWNGAYWYSRLAEASDGLFIMGYGYHWTGGGPGPNAPLEDGDLWSQWTLAWTIQDYFDADTPADKIVLGLPTYGQEWPVSDSSAVPGDATDDGWSVTYAEAVDAADTYGRYYEDVSETAWYASSSTRQAWYDDSESLGIKMQWAVDEGLQGFGFWAIGYDEDDPAFWAAVDSASQEDPVDTGTSDTDTDDPGTPDDGDSGEPAGGPPRAHLLPAEEAGCACENTTAPPIWGLFAALALLGASARRS